MNTVAAPAEDMLPRDCTFDPADWRILAAHWYRSPSSATACSIAFRKGLRSLGLSRFFTA